MESYIPISKINDFTFCPVCAYLHFVYQPFAKHPAFAGIVPRKELWPIIQKEKWYHVPVASAHEYILKAEYVAFYFPEIFDKSRRNKIIYFAKVLGIETAKRIELFQRELFF